MRMYVDTYWLMGDLRSDMYEWTGQYGNCVYGVHIKCIDIIGQDELTQFI